MRSLNLHLKVLIAILLTLGVAITAYQIFVQGIPVTEAETDDLWNIDAKVDFVATPKTPVKVQMFVPPLSQDYVSLNESFVSNNYGVSINRADGNRKVTWSARRANGKQTLYYRLVLTKRYTGEKTKEKGPIFRDSLPLEGPEKIAAEALLAPIRQHSAGRRDLRQRSHQARQQRQRRQRQAADGRRHQPGKESAYRRDPAVHRPRRWSGSTPSAWSPTCNRARNCGCAASTARTGFTSTWSPANRACPPIA
ncbi:UUP1 family membrane protein [Pseudomonas aeruginosa]|nr:UUP1 family membrane protein [Pseudomonas aeruginosa]